MLKSKIDALSYVGGINVLDADGKLINSSVAWPAPPVNVADRAYFKTFKSGPQSPAVLVEPVYSRITGVWTTVIARKVTGPNGEFLGVIGRGIEPANFEKFFASVALGSDAAIAMHHRDGTLLARYPHVAGDDRQEFQDRPGQPATGLRTRPYDVPPDQSDRRQGPRDLLARAEQVSNRDRRGDDHCPPRSPTGASRSAS